MAERRIVVPPEHSSRGRVANGGDPLDPRLRASGRNCWRCPTDIWACGAYRTRAAPSLHRACSSTASTRRGRSSTPKTRAGWPESVRRSSTCPTRASSSLYVEDEPLFIPTARTPEYLRVLDMRNGVLSADLVWATPSGKHARVRSTRLVSFEHRVLAVSYEVTLDRPAPVVLRSGRQPCQRRAQRVRRRGGRPAHRPAARSPRPRATGGGSVGDRLVLGYQTVESG